jgi:hypothetical protein
MAESSHRAAHQRLPENDGKLRRVPLDISPPSALVSPVLGSGSSGVLEDHGKQYRFERFEIIDF